MSWHNKIIDAVFLLFWGKNRQDCKTVPRYERNKIRQALLKQPNMTIWHSLNCWKILSTRILHLSHTSVLHYRKHPSHTSVYFGWILLWKEPEVKLWLTEMTSADQSEARGPCRPCPAVGKDFGNKGKSLYPQRALRPLSTRQLCATPQCSIITTPTGWKKRKWK